MQRAPRIFDFVQLDVFTRTPLAGNPLAVFSDAHGLTDREMQALAREMNLSETTFILPRQPKVEAEQGTRVRIFTVEEELPFAGHPTLGTALYLYSKASSATDAISLDLNVGKIDISFRAESSEKSDRVDGNVFAEMRQRDPEFGKTIRRDELATALGENGDQVDAGLSAQIVSTGLPFAIVPLPSLDALTNLKPDFPRLNALLQDTGARFCYFIAPEQKGDWRRIRARMFFYGGEDPATGSAAGCAVSWITHHRLTNSDEPIIIRQGIEAGRPGEIFGRAQLVNGKVTDVRIGGYAVEVLRGKVTL